MNETTAIIILIVLFFLFIALSFPIAYRYCICSRYDLYAAESSAGRSADGKRCI